MPYRIIEPARIDPSFGDIATILEYREYLLLEIQEGKELFDLGFIRFAVTEYPSFSEAGILSFPAIDHPLWHGSREQLRLSGVVSTIQPSYLRAVIQIQDPKAGQRSWTARDGIGLSPPIPSKVVMPLDFTSKRDAAVDWQQFKGMLLAHLVEIGLAVEES